MGYLNTEELKSNYNSSECCRGAGYLRFILMAFVCFWNYGFPEPTGFLSAISGFAIPAFYILSGYFVLTDDKNDRQKKTERKMKRSVLCFAAMFVFYLIINVIVCYANNISVTLSRRTIFNFVVLNLWFLPVGSNIWFIQALFYAYIIIYAADWLGLMKHYKPVMVLTFIFMLLTGEFAGVIHFSILGYTYIPGNWLTRALPYLLLGRFLREKSETLFNIKTWVYVMLLIVGAVLSLGEIILLGRTGFLVYQGHMIGYGIMAFSACGLALTAPEMISTRITYYDTALSGLIYIFMDPLYYAIGLIVGRIDLGVVLYLGGIIALVASIVLAFILRKSIIARAFFTLNNNTFELKDTE